MTKYARVKDGYLTDVWRVPEDFPSIEARDRSLGSQGWISVPDDILHGAKDNGDGAFTNPGSQTSTKPVIFDSADWKRYAYGVLGAIAAPDGSDQEKLLAGMSRYGAILKAARASANNMVIAAVDQYDSESRFRKDQVIIFLKALNDDNEIVTGAEYTAIITDWPEV